MWPPFLLWTLFTVALLVALPVLMLQLKSAVVIGFWTWLLLSASFQPALSSLQLHPTFLCLFGPILILVPALCKRPPLTLGHIVFSGLVLFSLRSHLPVPRDSVSSSGTDNRGEYLFALLCGVVAVAATS
ncbi:hypothetical protein GGR58DRAFT_411715 [Xylaria digitata]|nr:hypothetical protein GGR58DRAFT_411715 [Xylaria digitata]